MSLRRQIDDICDGFEAAWKAGEQPVLASFIEQIAEEFRSALAKELIPLDVECRVRFLVVPNASEYAAFGDVGVEIAQRAIDSISTQLQAKSDAKENSEYAETFIGDDASADSAGDPDPSDDNTPQIGPYKLIEKIGEGGMGSVYMAEQTEPVRRRVALKLIKAGVDNKEVIARFEAERQALAMMDHQHIAKVLDAGTTNQGSPFFVMELVNGIPITDYCDKHKLPLNDRLQLFTQSCKAIQHAHQKGIIHRDIKPTNVLVAEHDGAHVVKVIDFGLAKALQSPERLTDATMFTAFGQVLGTLQYMSPEQAGFEAMDVDTRSDVYSLGILLYELLTGSTPIEKKNLRELAFDKILAAIREVEAPRPSSRLSSLGASASDISKSRKTDPRKLSLVLKGDLDWIAVKALEKDRNRRYKSASDLADDMQRFLTGDAIQARPPSFAYRMQKTVRKHRLLVTAGALAFALLAIGIAGTVSQLFRARTAEGVASEERSNAAQSDAEAITAAKKAKDARQKEKLALERKEAVEARANYVSAVARWDAGRASEANELLHLVPERHRHFEWNLARDRFRGSYATCYGAGSITSVSWSSDATQFATAGFDAVVRLWDATTCVQLQSLDGHGSLITSVKFSPDGSRVASGGYDKKVILWDAETGAELDTLIGHSGYVTSLAFSPDGTRLATGSHDKSVKLWDIKTGECLSTLEGHTHGVLSVSFGPDGTRLASGDGFQTIKLWNTVTGEELMSLNGHSRPVYCVAFSPDGTRIASGSADETLKLWDAATGNEIATLEGHSGKLTSVNFSPDATQIASGSSDGTIKLWHVASRLAVSTLKGHLDEVTSVAFSPDGARIVSGSNDRTAKIWDTTNEDHPRTIDAHKGSVTSIDFSPDSDRIASGSQADTEIKLWDTASGAPVTTLGLHCQQAYGISFDRTHIRAASAGADEWIRSWDATTGTRGTTVNWHNSGGMSMSFSPNAKQIASGGHSGAVSLWDAATGAHLSTMKGHTNVVESVTFSPDGKQIASGSGDGTVKLWDATTGKEFATLKEHHGIVRKVAFSADGKWIASGSSDRTVKLWDVTTGELLSTLNGHTGEALCVCFSPDSTRLASGSTDGTIKLWETSTGDELATLGVKADSITSVAFSPNGMWLAAGDADGTVKMWNGQTDSEFIPLNGHNSQVVTAKFNSDGSLLFSSSGSEIYVWDTSTRLRIPDQNGELRNTRDKSSEVATHERWRAVPSGNSVLLVNRHFERVYREFKAEPKLSWHQSQAEMANANGDWFASMLHTARLFELQSDSESAYENLHRCHASRPSETPNVLPPIAVRALALPAPGMSPDRANWTNSRLWKKVVSPDGSLSPAEINELKLVCRDHPRGVYFNTLGVAQYRNGDFQAAVTSLTNSLSRLPAELKLPGPHPGDLAFLAMSHHKLGNVPEAADFQRRMKTAAGDIRYAFDTEIQAFLAEANVLFDGPEAWPVEASLADFERESSFEETGVNRWRIHTWRNNPKQVSLSRDINHSGETALQIRVDDVADDVMVMQTVAVHPNSDYRLSGWIRTEDVTVAPNEKRQVGACFAINDQVDCSESVIGTTDWKQICWDFTSGNVDTLDIGCRLGHNYSTCTGKAWFDDLVLVRVLAKTLKDNPMGCQD